jgi:ABC-2 type transport system permease protein
MNEFSWSRVFAILAKEFIQIQRQRSMLVMIAFMPLFQLFMYGFAINGDPHHMKAAVLIQDEGPFARSIVAAMNNTGYLDVVAEVRTPGELDKMMALGDAVITVTIPRDFTRRVVRHEHAQILVEADASDPMAIGGALGAVTGLPSTALVHDLVGTLAPTVSAAPFETVVHRRYNPENITAYNIVPGLLGTMLSMTLVMMTASSLTKEVENGTMESLLATSVRSSEIMLGKLVPYFVLATFQAVLIITASRALFDIPMAGGWDALVLGLTLFIIGSLSLGYLISVVSKTQQQAQMYGTFWFMPSMMLSGFMFPFSGMPAWAQAIGTVVPTTHVLRVVRGSMLKGYGIAEAWPPLMGLGIFVVVVAALSIWRSRTTID